jgi:hypothetical protein
LTKAHKTRRTAIVKSGTKDGGVDVLFKDRNEHKEDSGSNEGEKVVHVLCQSMDIVGMLAN